MIQQKMNLLLFIIVIIPTPALAQTNGKARPLRFTKKMDLKITPSATSSQNDFDFLVGKWKVYNRKLKTILNNSDEWSEFESTLHMKKTLNGMGNIEDYYATFGGKPFEGMAVRLFNPHTKLWTVYWMDTSSMIMDQHPVTGSFENGLGKLYAKDTFNGKEIVVLYQWDATNAEQPKWSQAFSTDEGKTWEWNWEMKLSKIF
jgi:hypothetical protein